MGVAYRRKLMGDIAVADLQERRKDLTSIGPGPRILRVQNVANPVQVVQQLSRPAGVERRPDNRPADAAR